MTITGDSTCRESPLTSSDLDSKTEVAPEVSTRNCAELRDGCFATCPDKVPGLLGDVANSRRRSQGFSHLAVGLVLPRSGA